MQKHFLNTFLFIPLIFISSLSEGQSNFSKNLLLRADLHYGFIIPEYKHFVYQVNKPVTAVEISLSKKTTGKTFWSQIYKYPEYGVSLLFSTQGNYEIFGNEIAIYPYLKSFLIRKKRFQLSTQFGLGFGYATKEFNLETNYENVSIGSHSNIHFNFKLGSSWILNERFSLNSGLSFSHYSNANMAEPNLGVNSFTAYTGINCAIGPQTEFTKTELIQHKTKHEFAFMYNAGGKHTRALQSDIYFTSSVSAEYKYHIKRKLHIGAGLDMFYDSSTEIEMGATGETAYKPADDFRTGFHISQELVYDRFSFILQEGLYVGLVDKVNNSFFYNRAFFRWKINSHLLINLGVRSHLHILDYPEIGFGYYFTSEK